MTGALTLLDAPSQTRHGPERGNGPLADEAYAVLRERIIALQLPPGAPIDDHELGKELGVGRATVRDAVKRLVLERLATTYPRRGCFVAEITATDLRSISEVRAVLEGRAAWAAAQRFSPHRAHELEAVLADFADTPAKDPHAAVALQERAHRFIHRAAGNSYMEDTLALYLALALRIANFAIAHFSHRAADLHLLEETLRAIHVRDAAEAQTRIVEHVMRSDAAIRVLL